MGSSEYEDRSQHLQGLPSPSTDFFTWLQLTDRQRLGTAHSDIQTFQSMLEWKREQLKTTTNTNSTVPQSFHHIECDLRDLLKEVSSQIKDIGGTSLRPHSPRAHRASSSMTQWDSRVKGYIILRDLDLYLIKLARDFLLLATKTTRTQRQTGQSN